MNNAIKSNLIDIAKRKALLPFHGTINNIDSNLKPIIDLFPKWSVKDADNCWCSAFVYYCLVESGFEIPYSPKECVTCSLAGCGGFLEFAIKDNRIDYITDINLPNIGDIVIFDYLFCNKEHDHIGIIIVIQDNYILFRGKYSRHKSIWNNKKNNR